MGKTQGRHQCLEQVISILQNPWSLAMRILLLHGQVLISKNRNYGSNNSVYSIHQ